MICILILLSLPWILFWQVTVGHRIWSGGDISAYHYPLMVISATQWRDAHLPLWNPYLFGGTPLAAAQQASVFYPLNVVLWLTVPPWLMMGYSVLLHLSLAGVSVFLLLRSMKVDTLAAMLGGVAFQFCGFAMSHKGHVNIIRVLPWAGFVLWGFNRWIDTQKSRFLGLVSLGVFMLFLSGYPQVIVYSSLFVFSYPLFLGVKTDRQQQRLLFKAFLALLLGAGLSAIQTIPTAQMWFSQQYMRPGEHYYTAFSRSSFHPAYVLTMLFPWSRSGSFAEMVAYVGIPMCQ